MKKIMLVVMMLFISFIDVQSKTKTVEIFDLPEKFIGSYFGIRKSDDMGKTYKNMDFNFIVRITGNTIIYPSTRVREIQKIYKFDNMYILRLKGLTNLVYLNDVTDPDHPNYPMILLRVGNQKDGEMIRYFCAIKK